MPEEIAFENVRISNFEGLVTLTLTLDRSYCVSSYITHGPLPTCQISLKSKKRFVDGRTYGRAGGHLRPALLARLLSKSLPKNPIISDFMHGVSLFYYVNQQIMR